MVIFHGYVTNNQMVSQFWVWTQEIDVNLCLLPVYFVYWLLYQYMLSDLFFTLWLPYAIWVFPDGSSVTFARDGKGRIVFEVF
jgi:hypothetical protein